MGGIMKKEVDYLMEEEKYYFVITKFHQSDENENWRK